MDVVYYEQCEKISGFDILISDPYRRGDEYTVGQNATNISLQEVWEWLSCGGCWNFRVTATGKPDSVFMSGLLHDTCGSMRDKVDGKYLVNLVSDATREEMMEFRKQVHDRIRRGG